jgi:peptidoglycan/xylan/chitin deacetylase (PgdA/CDA1 family)
MIYSKKILAVLLIGGLLMTGCSPAFQNTNPSDTSTSTATATQFEVLDDKIEATPSPQHMPSATAMVPTPPETPSHTPTPEWIFHEPGEVIAPILLYHHVDGESTLSRYNVAIPDFKAQMQHLDELGFTPIPLSTFLDVLLNGGRLPEKPVVITFDDGHLSVYENAFPIMQELGFPGVFYIVANRINGSPDFVTIEQIKEMVEAGWEIGSHSYSHPDLTQNHAIADREIRQSKIDLENALSTPIETFAYPFGAIDPFSAQKVSDSTYRAGMGLGTSKIHTWNTLFYLNRIEIYGFYTIENFQELLASE